MPSPDGSGPGTVPPAGTPSAQSARGLDWFTFFVANLQAGFGPFVSVYLTSERWTQIDIGLVLTIGGVVGLFLQAPGGALVDAARSKRRIASWALLGVGLSAVGLATSSHFPVILGAWVLHALASCVLTPAIASLSLGLVGHEGLARRLGRNASFASFGNAMAAAVMGGIGYWVSNQAVFIVTGALMVPAFLALRRIRAEEIDSRVASGGMDAPSREEARPAGSGVEPKPARGWALKALLGNRPLGIFLLVLCLFFVANAAILPLIGSALTLRAHDAAAPLIAACIIAPQVMVAILSPMVGSLSQRWGRRPLLLIGFAVLPLRLFLLAFIRDPYLIVLVQVLDGFSAAILGVLVPLVVADVTRASGHYALAQGMVGTGLGLGASASTLVGGFMADRYGSGNAFLGFAIIAALAFACVLAFMPETRPAGRRPMPRE